LTPSSDPKLLKGRAPLWFWVVLIVLLVAAAWFGLRQSQVPKVTAEDACKKQCQPLPWQIKGEKRIPNAPEGWRNYPTRPRCVCG